MPPKRRSATKARNAPSGQQSTLTFHGKQSRVTKATSPRGGKAAKKDPARIDDIAKADVKEESVKDLNESIASESEQAETEQLDAHPDPLVNTNETTKTENVLGGRAEPNDYVGAIGGGKGSGWVGDEEQEARKITETQINRYWRRKEQERLAPRVHQQELNVHEKVLREWDMSGQYGPCVGIARLKRWKRANLLGLKPPMEVLAVLLKEMDAGSVKAQRAHVDELLTSRYVEP